MGTVILGIINFIVLFFVIKLIINKSSKFIINKLAINDAKFNYIKKIRHILTTIVISLNLIFLMVNSYIKSTLVISVIAIIDVILAIFMCIFINLEKICKVD